MSAKSHSSDVRDLKALLHEAEKALGDTTDKAGEKFEHLRERLRNALDHGRDSLDHLREQAARRAKQADHLIRENPYYAIGVAAGIGALIGLLVARSYQNSR